MANFWVPPMAPDMVARQHRAHVVSGLCYVLNTPASAAYPRHPIMLFHALDLHKQVDWYTHRDAKQPIAGPAARALFSLFAEHYEHNWQDMPHHSVSMMLDRYDTAQQLSILADVSYTLLCLHIDTTSLFERRSYMKQADHDRIPAQALANLSMSLASLDAALLAKDPTMPQHLRSIHSLLITYPEATALLDDSEVAKIIDGAEILTKTQIVAESAKGKVSAVVRKGKVQADML